MCYALFPMLSNPVAGRLAGALFYATYALGRAFNVTVDDTEGDQLSGAVPTYVAANGASWSSRSDTEPCDGCLATPDATLAHLRTWHDATSGPGQALSNASFSFTGTAVYIYCILANYIEYATTETHLSFYIDSELVGAYSHIPDISSTQYEYNQLLYSNTTILTAKHEFLIANHGDVGPGSLIMFDYALYTVTDDLTTLSSSITPTSSSTLPEASAPLSTDVLPPTQTAVPAQRSNGVQIGIGVAVGTIGIALLMFFFWFWARRRRARHANAQAEAMSAADVRASQLPTLSPFLLPRRSNHNAAQDGSVYDPYAPEQLEAAKSGSLITLPRGPSTSLDSGTLSTQEKGPAPASSVASTPLRSEVFTSGGHSHDSQLQEEVTRLREEVERLRGNDAPPPMYDEVHPVPAGATASQTS